MKVRSMMLAQIIFLIGASMAGLILKGDLLGGPRTAHKLFGGLAGILGIAVAIIITKHGKSGIQKVLAWLAVAMTFVAGVSGKSLQTTGSYDAMFALMRFSAFIALMLAVVVLTIERRKISSAKIEHEDSSLSDDTDA